MRMQIISGQNWTNVVGKKMYKDVLVEIADWWGSSPITGNEEWVRKMDGSTLHFILAQKLINYTGKLQFLIGTLSTAWIHHSRSMMSVCVCVCGWMTILRLRKMWACKQEMEQGIHSGFGGFWRRKTSENWILYKLIHVTAIIHFWLSEFGD